MAIAVEYSLHQFSEVFKIRDSAGQPYILIGGQAVNYWAERYLAAEPQLKTLRPFTSQDIDFVGTHEDVRIIARQLNQNPGYPPKVAITALSGFVPFQIGDLKASIEVVRRIPGIPGSVEASAIQTNWEGRTIRVLNPIALLACKLELARTVSQEKRRDVVHLKILTPCVRAFLAEALQSVEQGELPANDWLGAANQVLKQTTTLRAKKIGREHQINWQEILPLNAIASSRNEKVRRFHELQLQQGFKKSKGVSI